MPICDMHTHTRISSDADQSVENNSLSFCKTAIERGIKHLAFTEHYDIIPDPGAITCDAAQAKNSAMLAKEKYGNRLNIMHGIELAHMHRPECMAEAKRVLDEVKPDFVLGSIHINDDGTDYYTMDFSKYSDEFLLSSLDDYLSQIIHVASACDFDSLAHCTYPLRYFHMHSRLGIVDMKKYSEPYSELFRVLMKRGKSLEINSSTLRGDYKQPLPCFELIKLYVDLGGKRFTLGSDGHHYDLVGTKIDDVQEYIKSLGIEGIMIYRNRQESFVKFD